MRSDYWKWVLIWSHLQPLSLLSSTLSPLPLFSPLTEYLLHSFLKLLAYSFSISPLSLINFPNTPQTSSISPVTWPNTSSIQSQSSTPQPILTIMILMKMPFSLITTKEWLHHNYFGNISKVVCCWSSFFKKISNFYIWQLSHLCVVQATWVCLLQNKKIVLVLIY